MDTSLNKRIGYLAQSAAHLRDVCNSETGSAQTIVFEKHGHGITITGNRSGLLELARNIIMVAAEEWNHADIDEAAFAERSAGVLTIALDAALN